MELKIYSLAMAESGKIKLPLQFNEEIRPDLIKRAVEVIQSNKRQPYGADPRAGKKASAKISRRRRKYRGSYGMGISRTPRKVLSRRGTRMNWVGALAPNTVGGRQAQPPKAEKIWTRKINSTERKKAIRAALAATVDKELVTKRGHLVPEKYPFIVEDKIESLDKTKAVYEALSKLGLNEELGRISKKSIRPGMGKYRGRKYRKVRGMLVVVADKCKLEKSIKNIPGIEVIAAKNLNTDVLAPGANPGRLTLFTKGAIEKIAKEKLFI